MVASDGVSSGQIETCNDATISAVGGSWVALVATFTGVAGAAFFGALGNPRFGNRGL